MVPATFYSTSYNEKEPLILSRVLFFVLGMMDAFTFALDEVGCHHAANRK